MIFKRYSSPLLFLSKLLENRKFSSGIDAIYKQSNEDKLWQLYLSMAIKEKSFIDWKSDMVGSNDTIEEQEKNLEAAKTDARNILKNFKKPQ